MVVARLRDRFAATQACCRSSINWSLNARCVQDSSADSSTDCKLQEGTGIPFISCCVLLLLLLLLSGQCCKLKVSLQLGRSRHSPKNGEDESWQVGSNHKTHAGGMTPVQPPPNQGSCPS
jgi:hypothetical protein